MALGRWFGFAGAGVFLLATLPACGWIPGYNEAVAKARAEDDERNSDETVRILFANKYADTKTSIALTTKGGPPITVMEDVRTGFGDAVISRPIVARVPGQEIVVNVVTLFLGEPSTYALTEKVPSSGASVLVLEYHYDIAEGAFSLGSGWRTIRDARSRYGSPEELDTPASLASDAESAGGAPGTCQARLGEAPCPPNSMETCDGLPAEAEPLCECLPGYGANITGEACVLYGCVSFEQCFEGNFVEGHLLAQVPGCKNIDDELASAEGCAQALGFPGRDAAACFAPYSFCEELLVEVDRCTTSLGETYGPGQEQALAWFTNVLMDRYQRQCPRR